MLMFEIFRVIWSNILCYTCMFRIKTFNFSNQLCIGFKWQRTQCVDDSSELLDNVYKDLCFGICYWFIIPIHAVIVRTMIVTKFNLLQLGKVFWSIRFQKLHSTVSQMTTKYFSKNSWASSARSLCTKDKDDDFNDIVFKPSHVWTLSDDYYYSVITIQLSTLHKNSNNGKRGWTQSQDG